VLGTTGLFANPVDADYANRTSTQFSKTGERFKEPPERKLEPRRSNPCFDMAGSRAHRPASR
jgi:hypothetical protein